MKKVYVTESGYFGDYGLFHSTGVISVDTLPRNAVSYLIRVGCYRHMVDSRIDGCVVIYKTLGSSKGYRLSVLDAF